MKSTQTCLDEETTFELEDVRLARAVSRLTRRLEGVWVSEARSRYLSDGHEFVCISAHDAEFNGWVGKTAIEDIQMIGEGWSARQAIRRGISGILSRWVPVTLSIHSDVITKFFSADVPGSILFYGHLERYHRVQLFNE